MAEVRTRKKVNRTKWNVWLDIALTLIFIFEMEEGFTGLLMHEALGLFFGTVLVLHIILHWDWVVSITRTFLRKLLHESRFNYVLNLAVFVDLVVVTVSGVLISRTLGLNFSVSRDWQKIHIVAAELSLMLIGVHVAMHWKWIITNANTYIFARLKLNRPVPQEVPHVAARQSQ